MILYGVCACMHTCVYVIYTDYSLTHRVSENNTNIYIVERVEMI